MTTHASHSLWARACGQALTGLALATVTLCGSSAVAATATTASPVAATVAAPAATAAPSLDLIVHHETTQTTHTGILRTERWSERFVRRDGMLWSERLRPSNAGTAAMADSHAHGAGHIDTPVSGKAQPSAARPVKTSTQVAPADVHHHKHFDYDVAARWVERDANGALNLRFVDTQRRMVVSVPSAEYSTVGFDGRWDAAAHLVPPALVAALPKQAGAAPAGAQWRVQHADGWTHRVLWSDRQQVALRIESRRDDGSFTRIVRTEPATSATQPWAQLKNFEQRQYDDFMD